MGGSQSSSHNIEGGTAGYHILRVSIIFCGPIYIEVGRFA